MNVFRQPLPSPFRSAGTVVSVQGDVVRVAQLDGAIGDRCEFLSGVISRGRGEVIGIDRDELLVWIEDGARGLDRTTLVMRHEGTGTVAVSPQMLGRVLDGFGVPIDEGPPLPPQDRVMRPVWSNPPPPLGRARVDSVFATGVRAIDGVLTLGVGQRVGIFAPAGVGKTMLLGMLARHCAAEVNVIALIGERGREVREFLEDALGEAGRARSVVVCATADASPIERLRCAYTAMAIAEGLRDQGRGVLLMVDSLTRFARAHREIGLAQGEMPTRRGFPTSLFSALPRLLERAGPGPTGLGSITMVATVLLEDRDLSDPVGEEVKSLLDGHLVLSPTIASQGRFPAIDLSESISRLASRVASADVTLAATRLRTLLAKHREVQPLVQIGEYSPGADPEADEALALHPDIVSWLSQPIHEASSWADCRDGLIGLVGGGVAR
jgi:type III secretion protein N (ATPase)